MNNWKYKYSKISGVLFILLFILKEITVYAELNKAFLSLIYILFLSSIVITFLAYLKYHYINENRKLIYVTITFLSSTMLYFILEMIHKIGLFEITEQTIVSLNIILALATTIWSISHIAKRRIYKHSLFLLGVVGILLGATYLAPVFSYLRVPMFILFYTLFTLPFYKKKEKGISLIGD